MKNISLSEMFPLVPQERIIKTEYYVGEQENIVQVIHTIKAYRCDSRNDFLIRMGYEHNLQDFGSFKVGLSGITWGDKDCKTLEMRYAIIPNNGRVVYNSELKPIQAWTINATLGIE